MPICGVIDCKASTTVDPQTQEQFKMLFNFFERMVAVGNCTRIALQYGAGGTGTGWYNEATPFGPNAFAVYEFSAASPKFTVMFQFGSYSTGAFGNSPGNPGVLLASYYGGGLGIIMAARADGTSPWAGTTLNNGADTKGATVWTPGSSTLYVLNRSCSTIATAGSYSTNKQLCTMFCVGYISTRSRLHCVGNSTGFVLLTSSNDSGGYDMVAGGVYIPRTGLVGTHTMPLVQFGYTSSGVGPHFALGSLFGLATGAGNYDGGIVGRSSDLVGEVYAGAAYTDFQNATLQPNQQPTATELDLAPYILAYGHPSRYGYVGNFDTDLLAYCYNVSNHQTNNAATRAYMAWSTQAAGKYAIPWDGGPAPGTLTTREGRTF
jgi:hypothetical protein